MKNFYFKQLFAAVLLLCSTVATAHDFEMGGIFYNIQSSTALTVEVTHKGSSYYDYSNEYSGSVNIPATVTYDGTTYSVTSIGSSAFSRCSGLTSVTIPEGVTSIGSFAFSGCTGLTSVTIPNSVTSIGSSAFNGCSSLKEVHISDLVAWCNVDFEPDSNPLYYAKNLYLNDKKVTDLIIPDGVTAIKKYAFKGCTGLTSVTIPGSVTSIVTSAFSGCSGLTSITIPNSVTSIGSWAFEGCTGLTSITIPNSVTSIGNCAFYYCKGLTSITIHNSVTSIGSSAFSGCTGLTSVTIPNSVTSIGERAFADCTGLTSVTIPNSVTSIGSSAFQSCTGLTSVTIPGSVTSIGSFAFLGCSGLTSVTIPNSVTSIGERAFADCTGLTSVTIPNSVTSIGSGAFYNCTGLKEVINYSNLTFTKGSTGYGYVAYYADKVANIPKGSIEGDFAFNVIDGVNTLVAYLGDDSAITLPDSYKGEGYVIGSSAFNGCSGLTSVTIPEGVTSIGSSVFYCCSNLKKLEINCAKIEAWFSGDNYNSLPIEELIIGDNTTEIGERAFYNMASLAKVTIGKNVKVIRNEVFSGCNAIETIYAMGERPALVGENNFTMDQYLNVKLYVPAGSLHKYEISDVWENFWEIEEFSVVNGDINGDINSDNKVDVGDVTILIGMILDASLLTDSGDINGDNKVDVGDVTTLVAIILGTSNTPARAAAMEEYNVELSVEGDEQSLTIDATATDYPYSAVQFDVYLPAGVKAIDNMVVGCGNAAAYKEQADGAVRVVIYSPSNTAIANKSASIAIDATGLALGSHPVEVKNIILAAPGRAKAIAWDSTGYITIADTTGINGVVSDAGNADAVVYDLQGHRVTEIVKGRVYIKNGSKFIAQ